MNRPRSLALLALGCCLFSLSGSGRAVAGSITLPPVGTITGITEPMPRQVVQRRDDNVGDILVIGTYSGVVNGFQARSVLQPGMQGTELDWTSLIDVTVFQGHFVGILRQPAGGFYNLQVRPILGPQVGPPVTVLTVGVGEVFITAGQSNSTNSGSSTGFYPSILVSSFDDGPEYGVDRAYAGAYWRWGYDPQPVIDGSTGGSAWPTMANNLAITLGVPVGLYSVGYGGTSIQQWLPGYTMAATPITPEVSLFSRLTNAISYLSTRSGVRAVLWDQGETDYSLQTNGQVYQACLRQIINQSRQATGLPVKWMVAQASSPLTNNLPVRIALEQAQANVVDFVLTFPGPNTDLIGLAYRNLFEGVPVHFNAPGLILLGGYWGIYVANIPGFLSPGVLPPP